MLDRLPAIARHLIILLLGALASVLLQWAGTDLVPWLKSLDGPVWSLVGALVAQVVLLLTPLVRQYGVGSQPPARD